MSMCISEAAARPAETTTTQRGADFMPALRKLILEELQFASNEMLERTQTEMHLLSELMSRMAAAHSVRNITAMYEECGKHQLEFFRRDWDRIFKHGERMIEATSNLFRSHELPQLKSTGPEMSVLP